jgi:hypothetical protein
MWLWLGAALTASTRFPRLIVWDCAYYCKHGKQQMLKHENNRYYQPEGWSGQNDHRHSLGRCRRKAGHEYRTL